MATHMATASSTSTVKPHRSSSMQTQSHSIAKRSQLLDLLPLSRHALFHVRLTIHQLWNVPLVDGSFSVKWKFHNAHSIRGSSSHKPKSIVTISGAKTKGKGKDRAVSGGSENMSQSDVLAAASTHSESSSSKAPSPRVPSIPLSPNSSPSLPSTPLTPLGEVSAEARGRTDFVELVDHNVKWGHSVVVAVQMDVQRETMELQPSELKLTVDQRVVHGDPDAPQNPRLGTVHLNLAEYVDKGPVTRRYLLRHSKTNATLQLTLEVSHIGGETNYKAPPLRKGEVMAGVANLLEDSPYGTLPRPTYSRKASRTDSTRTGAHSGPPSRTQSPYPGLWPAIDEDSLRTTDNIIEAIFNPVPTSSSTPSPFTYYVPPKARPVPSPLDISIADLHDNDDRPHSAVSTHTSMSEAQSQHAGDDRKAPSISARSERSQAPSSATSTSKSSIRSNSDKNTHQYQQQQAHQKSKWWHFGSKNNSGINKADLNVNSNNNSNLYVSRSRPTSPLLLSHTLTDNRPSTPSSANADLSSYEESRKTSLRVPSHTEHIYSGNGRGDAIGPQIFVRRPTSSTSHTNAILASNSSSSGSS